MRKILNVILIVREDVVLAHLIEFEGILRREGQGINAFQHSYKS